MLSPQWLSKSAAGMLIGAALVSAPAGAGVFVSDETSPSEIRAEELSADPVSEPMEDVVCRTVSQPGAAYEVQFCQSANPAPLQAAEADEQQDEAPDNPQETFSHIHGRSF